MMPAEPYIWAQAQSGRPIDMVNPRAEDVDFREIADVLAQLNRYAGNAVKQVSVAQHTLIVCDAVPEHLKRYALLHDAHEARIGDIITPTLAALAHLAELQFGSGAPVFWSVRELRRRHDMAIHMAAGVMVPTEAALAAVGHADLVALQTERRDFLAPCELPWAVDAAGVMPLRRVYRLRRAADVADELYARFRAYLPALAGGTASKSLARA